MPPSERRIRTSALPGKRHSTSPFNSRSAGATTGAKAAFAQVVVKRSYSRYSGATSKDVKDRDAELLQGSRKTPLVNRIAKRVQEANRNRLGSPFLDGCDNARNFLLCQPL